MKYQKGLSLLEIIFSLSVITVILTIIVNYFYTQNKHYVTITKAATQIQYLADMSYEWQTSRGENNFQGISETALQEAGLVSANDQYAQINPWGGHITISEDSDDSRYVLITLNGIPENACHNLRNRMNSIAHHQSSDADCAIGSYHISL